MPKFTERFVDFVRDEAEDILKREGAIRYPNSNRLLSINPFNALLVLSPNVSGQIKRLIYEFFNGS